MDAQTTQTVAASIGSRLADVFTRILAEELAKIDTPATGNGEPTVPLSEYITICERLDGILGDVGCGTMPEIDSSDFDLDSLAREAADAAYSAVESAIENADVPEIDTSEYEQASETVEQAVREAQALRDHMQEIIETAQNGAGV